MLGTPRRQPGRLALLAAALLAGAVAAGCSSDRMRSALYTVTPYKVEVVQGNVVTKEQVQALRKGMTRQQVREVLGTPLLTDIFHADRWDYVFTIRRQGVEVQPRRLTVLFEGDALARFEGDEMPGEEEFVAAINPRKKPGKVPQLEASEDQLKKYDVSAKSADSAASNNDATAPLPPSYPPLESN
ncbi:MAG: outer membrane protein assembly factor BamE [Xenophilus sp.]